MSDPTVWLILGKEDEPIERAFTVEGDARDESASWARTNPGGGPYRVVEYVPAKGAR